MTPDLSALQHERALRFLKRVAPFSVIERATQLSAAGAVQECARSGRVIQGSVRAMHEDRESIFPVTLQLLSAHEISATCSCSTAEEMAEQWCPHAAAVMLRATDLGFAEADGGFADQEAVFRMNTSTPDQIAAVLHDLANALPTSAAPQADRAPLVEIVLHTSSDRLGVQLLLDGEIQAPAVFEGVDAPSSRQLDNVLLQVLDEEGNWDETSRLWFINSSRSIEMVLGLIREYDTVRSVDGPEITFSSQLIDARLVVDWVSTGAQLSMFFLLPDGREEPKAGSLIGTGPYWVELDHTLYRLSPSAARIASIFPFTPSLSLTKSQLGPVLAAISSLKIDSRLLEIRHPELQPEARVEQPTVVLELEKRDTSDEHFSSSQQIQLVAGLEFEYPEPRANENIVYLPDEAFERECVDLLKGLGFSFQSERRRYLLSGDAALDVVDRGTSLFPSGWTVRGLEQIRKGVRFADLEVTVSIGEPGSKERGAIDWFECSVALTQNKANIPLSTLFKNVRAEHDRWMRLDNGAYARIPGGGLQQLKTTLGLLDPNFRLSNTLRSRLTSAQAISFGRLEDEQVNVVLDKRTKALVRRFREFDSVALVKPSRKFAGKLRSYQQEGMSWLNFLEEFSLGGILADEMGLGKTVQTLAFLQYRYEQLKKAKKKHRPTLIVAPTSVVTNWLYEARKFTPSLSVAVLHGPQRRELFSRLDEFHLLITSYALLRIDRPELERHKFDYVVLDEAQNIKNPRATTTRAAKALQSQHRLALTGTPTENRPLELWSIIDFLMPGYLGSLDFFRTYIERPITESGPTTQVAKFLNAKVRPFLLRRTKAEVERELPPKIESVLHVDMSDGQRALYQQILDEVRPRVFQAVEEKGVRGASVSILAALLRLRQVCNHPNSIESLREAPGFESGKFELLKELVDESMENGRKILLFSQFKEMLAIIRRWLEKRGYEHLYLDGTTRNRQELIDRFNNDEQVRLFLISLKAGGTGLNLTAADTVIIYDPWWNPAVESQAVDRAHRIGQTKKVSVYRLVTENSVEQKIMDLKERKAKLVEALVQENAISPLRLSKSDLEMLFSPLPSTPATTE